MKEKIHRMEIEYGHFQLQDSPSTILILGTET